MAEGDIVTVQPEGRRYKLGPFLKAGLLGVVYPGTNLDTYQREAAVKLPAPNLNPEALARFRQEYEVLNELYRQLLPHPHVPWVKKGSVAGKGTEAYVLQYIGEEQMLTNRLPVPDAPYLAREKMALQAASDYARLLVALHSLNYTCQDRKLADLRWQKDDGPAGGRLIVLDWNVVEKGAERRPEDIYLFGLLWYQLLAGRYPSNYLNPLDDALWRGGLVSYGTRRLLMNALVPALAGGYESASKLYEAVERRKDLLNLSAERLLAQARPLLERFSLPRYAQEAPELESEWQALDLVDLAYRLGADAQPERERLYQLVANQGDRLITQVQQAFLVTRYEEGEAAVKAAEAIANSYNDPHLRLKVARWKMLIRAGRAAVRERSGLRPIRESLAGYVAALEQLQNMGEGGSL